MEHGNGTRATVADEVEVNSSKQTRGHSDLLPPPKQFRNQPAIPQAATPVEKQGQMAARAALATPLVTRQPCLAHSLSRRRIDHCTRLAVRAAAAPVATDLQAELSSPAAVRKALLARGWDLAWVDGVTGEIQKRRLQASVHQIEAAVSFLESLGIPLKAVENMVAINKQILGQPVEGMRAVVEYAQRQGVSDAALVMLLEAHPNLLTYTASVDGKQLEKGQARASIDVVEDRRKAAGVSYYREGASFQSAPVSPYKPSAL